ncbi:major facilitator superfamily transporter 16 isoform X1 [Oratosquilla oratoria]|uniref:major facilitator superfamily transporter 16 isoform X1 n=1 Tax=Oratosquilla oratoria TaxID=337810 RepID=UPI003F7623DC
MRFTPPGVKALEVGFCANRDEGIKRKSYAVWIWIITFLAYCAYHLSRKPISVVKTVLHENCTDLNHHNNDSHWCQWKPFDQENYSTLLGGLDSSFLFAYAGGMFISGIIAERVNLSLFLSCGMILSGVFIALFGIGHALKIHNYWYYVVVQVLAGLMQTTGWPGVVTAMGNWYGKGKRGLIFGVWNSHTSVGNILGTLIAAAFVEIDWTLSFVVPGAIIAAVGIIIFFFMPETPSVVGLQSPYEMSEEDEPPLLSQTYNDSDEQRPLLEAEEASPEVAYIEKSETPRHEREERAISLFSALQIPGVVEFSMCLFFAKLVSYTFLYWLPMFIKDMNESFDSQESSTMSIFFDVGGIVGGIIAGILSDLTGMPASTCIVMLVFAIPMLLVYIAMDSISVGINILLLIIVGLLVNGPYALITTAVSAELGTHKSLKGNAKALATVTSIIDGTGSIGAAVGPLIAGALQDVDLVYVFYMLMASDFVALLMLIRLVNHEIRGFVQSRRLRRMQNNLHNS